MNICLMNTAMTWGGGEKWHLEMSVEMSKKGHKVFIVTNNGSVLQKKAEHCEIGSFALKINNFSFLNPFKYIHLSRFFKRNNIQAVILNLPSDLKVGGVAARIAGIKKIIYRRGSAIPVTNSISNRLLFGNVVSGVIANSQETKNTILQNNKKLIQPERIKVIYNGLDIPELDQQHNKKRGNIIFGNMGRLVEQKGQDILIEIASLLKEKMEAFKLIIAGEGRLKESLLQLAEEKRVRQYIEFQGFVEDTWSFMQSIDVFLFPSRWEGFGYVIVEAMACGKPVIAFNVSSNPELIKNGFNGYLVPPGKVNEFADKAWALATNPDLLHKLGSNGKNFAEKNFRLLKTVNEVENFIFSL